mmetsp:Transcript_6462/g.13830  ORF Transcript_6462/g.13830 Transcript_6462/m.13830 type:complete len:173 (+) Transcript_6462:149-667(+)
MGTRPARLSPLGPGQESPAWMEYLVGSCRAVLHCELLSRHESRMCWEANRCFGGMPFRCAEAKESFSYGSTSQDSLRHPAGWSSCMFTRARLPSLVEMPSRQLWSSALLRAAEPTGKQNVLGGQSVLMGVFFRFVEAKASFSYGRTGQGDGHPAACLPPFVPEQGFPAWMKY